MSKPICPRCNSTRVVGYAFSAGHDQCQACGLLAPVREFHSERRASDRPTQWYKDDPHEPTPADYMQQPILPAPIEPKPLTAQARKIDAAIKSGRLYPGHPDGPKAGDHYWWQDDE